MSGLDLVQQLQDLEANVNAYKKNGDKGIFKTYFKWADLLDSEAFCDVVDAQPFPLLISIF